MTLSITLTPPVTTEPVFVHDCDECIYLGAFHTQSPHRPVVDLYVHHYPAGGESLLYRWSDDGPEYASGSRESVEHWAGVEVPGYDTSVWQELLARELVTRELKATFISTTHHDPQEGTHA